MVRRTGVFLFSMVWTLIFRAGNISFSTTETTLGTVLDNDSGVAGVCSLYFAGLVSVVVNQNMNVLTRVTYE